MIPWVYAMELLEARIAGRTSKDLVYVEDDLFKAYDDGLVCRYRAVEHGDDNLLFQGVAIAPMSARPTHAEHPANCWCRRCRLEQP